MKGEDEVVKNKEEDGRMEEGDGRGLEGRLVRIPAKRSSEATTSVGQHVLAMLAVGNPESLPLPRLRRVDQKEQEIRSHDSGEPGPAWR